MATREDSIIPLLPDNTYHIYNRGINKENIFKEERNYNFFLSLFDKYCSSYLDTFAYCLIPNHFHLAIRPKNEEEIFKIIKQDYERLPKNFLNSLASKNINFDADLRNLDYIPTELKRESAAWFVSDRIKIMMTSFSKSLNNQEKRKGSLLEKPFKRKLIESEAQLQYLIWYIHRNPVHHKISSHYSDYEHSSFQSFLSRKPTKIKRKEVFNLFQGKDKFIDYHEKAIENWEEMQHLNIEK